MSWDKQPSAKTWWYSLLDSAVSGEGLSGWRWGEGTDKGPPNAFPPGGLNAASESCQVRRGTGAHALALLISTIWRQLWRDHTGRAQCFKGSRPLSQQGYRTVLLRRWWKIFQKLGRRMPRASVLQSQQKENPRQNYTTTPWSLANRPKSSQLVSILANKTRTLITTSAEESCMAGAFRISAHWEPQPLEDRAGPSKDLATVAGSHPKKCWRGHLSIHTRLPVSPAPLTFSTQLLTYIVLLQSLLTPHSDCCGLSPLLSSSPLTYRCKTLTPLPNSWPPSPAPWDPRGRDDLAFCTAPPNPHHLRSAIWQTRP